MKVTGRTNRTREIWNKRGHVVVTIAAVGEHHDHPSPEFFKISSSPKYHSHRRRHFVVRTTSHFSSIDDVPVISEMSSSCFSRCKRRSSVLSKGTIDGRDSDVPLSRG